MTRPCPPQPRRRRGPRRARPRAARGRRAPSGPVCVLAGAGTGKTRAITHRIAYGVHARRLPAAAGPRGDLHRPGRGRDAHPAARPRRRRRAGPHLPRRGAAPAALLLAAGDRRRRARGAAAQGRRSSPRPASPAAAASSTATAVRDLAAEVEWAKVSMLTPETYAGGGAPARRRDPAGLDATGHGAAVRRPTRRSRPSAASSTSRTCCCSPSASSPSARTSPGPSAASTATSSSTSTRTSTPLQQRLLDLWLGERDDVCVVGDPAQTIYSFTGASPRPPARLRRSRYPQAQRGQAGAQLPVDAAGRRPGQPRRCARPGQDARLRLVDPAGAAAEPAPSPELRVATPTTRPRPPASPRQSPRWSPQGTPPREIAVLFRTNAQSEAFEAALADAGIPYLVRGGERFFARKEVRQAVLLLRGAARGDDGSRPLGRARPRRPRRCRAGAERPPASGGAVRERWESLQALAALADDLVAAAPDARLPELVASSTSAPPPSTRRPCRASRWRRCTRPRAWSGTAVFLVGLQRRADPDHAWPTDPAAVEEERRLLYVGLTRARRELRLSWSGSRNPGGRSSRRPSRFLDGAASVLGEGARSTSRTAGRRRRRRASRRRSPSRRGAAPAGPTSSPPPQRKIGRCDDCPPTYDEATFEALRTWRLAVAERDEGAGLRRLHRRHADRDRRAHAVRRRALSPRISGVGAAKLERYGTDVLDLLKNFSDAE